MTKVDDGPILLTEDPLAEPEAENAIMKRADRYLIAGICIAGTWAFGPLSIPFLLMAYKLLNQAQREGKLTRPWAVTILATWCLIDAAINFIFWGTDLFMAHDTDLLKTMWSGYAKLFDGAYYIDYNSTALGGTANVSEKAMEFMGVLIVLPMRMAAAWGFLKMKRWGLQAMVMTSYMWLALWMTYIFQMYLTFNGRQGASLFGITGVWALFIPFATPFVILPYLYTVNRERFAGLNASEEVEKNMATVTARAFEAPVRRPVDVPVEPRKAAPVKAWAVAGGIMLAFQLFVWTRWILGPNFERVPSGPSEPPHWMKVVLNTWQAVGIPVLLLLFYWFLIRPWRRERRVTTDGLLCAAFLLLSFQDPLSSYFGHWFTYNSYLFNRGSWVSDVPGWLSYGEPGKMLVEPILFAPIAYVYFCLGLTMLGCGLMRRVKARWPEAGTFRLVGACYALMMLASFVIEGLLWMPLGFYTYAGGIASIFPEHYYKYPIHEGMFLGAALTGLTCLRYFKNDKGQTMAERGLDSVRATPRQAVALRFLALLGAVHAIFFVGYNVPNTLVGAHSNPWPKDLVKRSYFTNYICGAETDRACPGPGVPLSRGDSARLGPDGRLVVPAGTGLPEVVPFDRG